MGQSFAETNGSEDHPVGRTWAQRWAGRRQFYPHLAAMPVFSSCARRQIWRVARWGDVIEVQPGDVLAREDRSNHWFFVILAGSVKVTHGKRIIATLQRGGHFGEVAVIGFRPQPATVTVAEPSVLFVVSRRLFVSLVAMDQTIQRALFPDVAPDEYRHFVREMHEEGRHEWERLKPHLAPDPRAPASPARPLPPGRRLSWADAVESLTKHDQNRAGLYPVPPSDQQVAPLLKRSTLVALGLVAAVLLAAFGLGYHPPLAVLTAARPIDVVDDITITGIDVDEPTGSYLLTAVSVDRPSLLGAVFSWMRGRRVVSIEEDGAGELDVATERRLARRAFLNSHRQAVALAERSLGVDPRGLTIVIRDRGIGGPSAGLVYALAIIDMLDPADLANGRVIAATGELAPDGKIADVGFISVKVEVARSGGADLFIVPAGQLDEATSADVFVIGAKDLKDAVRAVKQRR